MAKPTQLMRGEGDELTNLEGRVVKAEPTRKPEHYFVSGIKAGERSQVSRHLQEIISLDALRYGANAYRINHIQWVINKKVPHWEQEVQYYILLEN